MRSQLSTLLIALRSFNLGFLDGHVDADLGYSVRAVRVLEDGRPVYRSPNVGEWYYGDRGAKQAYTDFRSTQYMILKLVRVRTYTQEVIVERQI